VPPEIGPPEGVNNSTCKSEVNPSFARYIHYRNESTHIEHGVTTYHWRIKGIKEVGVVSPILGELKIYSYSNGDTAISLPCSWTACTHCC
jgi:hypothetical protein